MFLLRSHISTLSRSSVNRPPCASPARWPHLRLIIRPSRTSANKEKDLSRIIRPSNLIRPIVFTCGIHKWWHDQLSDGQRVFYSILTINLFVFAGWRIPMLRAQMNKYFTLSPLVGASLASLCYKVAVGSTVASLGASGAILGVVSFVCTALPNSQLLLLFIPMSANHAIKAIMTIDTLGLLLRWSLLDHAAHLGGTLYGQLYFHEGRLIYSEWSQSVVNTWKELKVKLSREK